jgi:hypothetical protein
MVAGSGKFVTVDRVQGSGFRLQKPPPKLDPGFRNRYRSLYPEPSTLFSAAP